MSLAASGGGLGGAAMGGGGGMAMAHQVHSLQVPPPQPPPQANTTGASAPPPSAAFLGADLLDKSQGLTLKNVKNVAHLPIVALDLHGSEAHVALFPKKPEDPSKGVPPVAVSKLVTDITFQKGDLSHKTLRKYLGKSKSFATLKTDTLSTKLHDSVLLKKPYRWLGLRRIQDAPEFLRKDMLVEEASGPEIAEEVLQGVGACVANSTLDGSVPTGDDFDRVVFKVRLHESKKTTSILPEEAVEMTLHQAKCIVAAKIKANADDEEMDDYPVVVALPAWAFHDAAIEAMLDAIGGGGSVLVQRNVAALAGALLPSLDGQRTPLLERLNNVHVALQKQHQIRCTQDPDAILEDEITLLVFGMTEVGLEMTAILISSLNMENVSCLFGVFKVLSNVSYLDSNPISRMSACAKKLEETVETIAPEADGPAGIILCGTTKEQKQMMSEWEKVKNQEWSKVPLFVTGDDCVAKGAAVLGAVSHGRLSQVEQAQRQKARAGLAIRVQNVAPVAVGIQMNYHGDAGEKWAPVKTIFDFDRQIPAGPNSLDLNAAECAVYRSNQNADDLSEEDFLKAKKMNEGAKGIPQREEAALNLRVRILQRWTRDGEWMQVGDTMEPLVQKIENKDGSVSRIGCENVTWELSIGVTGMITTVFVGERESVVVATKSARNSAIRYYLGIIFAILFFGGFLFKSYWDEHVLNRDTARLLAYYKRALPGSYQDGDLHSARYTCYKYRHKKAKLWRNLEKKYGIPVLTVKEYEKMDQHKVENTAEQLDTDDETVDLDDKGNFDETDQETQDL